MNAPASQEARWSAEIAKRLAEGEGLEFSLAEFARAVSTPADDSDLEAFLDQAAATGATTMIHGYRCPVSTCRRPLSDAGAPYSSCPFCQTDYQLEGLEPVAETFYRLAGENSRDIRWMIVIHGMNSRAAWQEEFSWQIANRLRYSAPILIYKYGWATIDVLVRWMHRRLAKRLGERMRVAIDQAIESGRPPRPDIIAHSFGTHLLALILADPEFSDLNFGRVITAGSIIRPDFDWGRHLADQRVEAVLNHVAAKDRAVPAAQYMIPGTGPGGKAGYTAVALNVRAPDFGHSDFFKPEILRQLIADQGLWHSFLTRPLAPFSPEGRFTADHSWKPASLFLRVPARLLGWALFAIVAPFSWLRRQLDS